MKLKIGIKEGLRCYLVDVQVGLLFGLVDYIVLFVGIVDKLKIFDFMYCWVRYRGVSGFFMEMFGLFLR